MNRSLLSAAVLLAFSAGLYEMPGRNARFGVGVGL